MYREHEALVAKVRGLENTPKTQCPTCAACPTLKPCKPTTQPGAASTSAEDAKERERKLAIRTKLGEFLNSNNTIKNSCLMDVTSGIAKYPCMQITNGWLQQCYVYIQKNMEPSYAPRFAAASGMSLSYNGAHGDQEIDSSVNTLTFKAAILNEFIKEMH